MSDQKPPEQGRNWRKAFILTLVFVGIGAVMQRISPDSEFAGGAMLAALVCAVIGTVWAISAARNRGD